MPGDVYTPRGAAVGACVGGLVSMRTAAAFLWITGCGPLRGVGRLAALLQASVEGTLMGAAIGTASSVPWPTGAWSRNTCWTRNSG